MTLEVTAAVDLAGAVAGEAGAREHTGRGAAQRGRVDPGVFQRLPGDLEHQPLLRVHRQRLARADPEERRVELPCFLDESAVGHVRAAGGGEGLEVPAARARERPDRVGAGLEHVPQPSRVVDPARKAAAHTDDRDRLALGVLQLAQTPPGLLQVGGDDLQIIAKLVFVTHPGPIPSE
ncbi:hypothetical protein Kisp01_36110 [Kineosporia sp. NBRC 101677]|nr:hypothetical protein Kisp01_36110 [Kineosporia sp. NBRC 101677]